MKKRILSLLLALALLCAVLPQITWPAHAEPATSGTCGDNLTWRFNKNTGTLTIEGNGKMSGFYWDIQPWRAYMQDIKKVVFPDGLTTIGSSAFNGCTGLTSVTFPAGLAEIGNFAFFDCAGLTSITLPAGLTSIGAWAFDGCTGLTAFFVATENPNFSTDANGVLFDKEKAKLILYPSGRVGSYAIPQSVTSIGNRAFRGCTGLTSITFPDGLTEIYYGAFEGCTGLTTSVTLPDGLTSIGDYAFCRCTGLTSVTLPAGLTSISEGAFYDCTGLKSVTLPAGLTSIGSSAFHACLSLPSVTFPDGLTSIGEGAFQGCSELTSISLPDGLTEIGGHTFFGCTRLTSVTFPDGLTSIGECAFDCCWGLTSISFPDGLTSIGNAAFGSCNKLTSITFPDGLASIGSCAFESCPRLTSVTIPVSLTEIGTGVFHDCSRLQELFYRGNVEQYAAIEERLEGFFKMIHYNVEDPTSHWTITGKAPTCTEDGEVQKNCPCGYEVIESVPALGHDFQNGVCIRCGFIPYSGTCGDNLTWRFNKNTGTLTIEGSGKMSGFDWNAQPWEAYMQDIKKVVFPAGLTSIGSWAFGGCTALTTITFPDGLTSIGSCAFYDCAGLTSVTLPAGLTEIDSSAFEGCAGLTSVTLPAGLTSIGSDTFYGCTGLTSVTFPAGLTSIGEQAFYGCTGLTSVALPAGLTSIGGWAFEYCTGLTSITFPDGLTSIGGGAFEYCTGLTSVTFPAGLASIGSWAFAGCTGLTSVIIPASVTEIGWSVFRNVPHESFTIYGYKGTAAQDYANENGFKFVPLDPASGFADVKPKHYYYNAMLWALERGITSGTSRVTFSPNDTCTRGQVMTFLYAAKGKPEADWSNNPFVDVKKSKYYFKPVLWAYQNGITNGVDDTHFQPNGGCTRAQVVTFLWALSGKPEPKAGSNPFQDIKKSNWFYKAVLWAYQNGVTSGVDATHFGPTQTCTRGQVVTFLYALLAIK